MTWGRDRFATSGGRRRCFIRGVEGPPVCRSLHIFPEDLHAPAAYRITHYPAQAELVPPAESRSWSPDQPLVSAPFSGSVLIEPLGTWTAIQASEFGEDTANANIADGPWDCSYDNENWARQRTIGIGGAPSGSN